MPKVSAGHWDGGSVEVNISAVTFGRNVKSVSFGHSLDAQKVYSLGSQTAQGYTQGQINADDGSLEIFTQDLLDWVESSGGPFGWHNTEFEVTINYRMLNMPLNTIVLSRCRPKKATADHAIGSEALTTNVEFYCLDVVYNGIGGLLGKAVQELLGAVGTLGSLI